MNRLPPPPPPPQQRAAPAQPRPAAAPAPGAVRTAPATPPSAGSPPAPGLSAPATQAPQNLGIDPVAAGPNDPSLGFEWKSRVLGSNHTWGCVVSAAQGDSISLRVAQSPYDRTLRGVGAVEVVAIPVAAAGTTGTLTARNETTGAVAEFNWIWSPFEPRHAAAKPKTVPSAKPAGPATAAKQQTLTTGAPTQASVGSLNAAALQARAGSKSAGQGFFGMQATGKRVAFILDRSGSMVGHRWEKCTQELAQILWSLDSSVQIYVVLFCHWLEVPPGQEGGWTPADPERKAAIMSWIQNVRPDGGTCPRLAFDQLYSMAVRPTSVFFLTDGQFTDLTAEDCARLQNTSPPSETGGLFGRLRERLFGPDEGSQGQKAVINTITLDDPVSAPVMQQIAAESGGQYVHATST